MEPHVAKDRRRRSRQAQAERIGKIAAAPAPGDAPRENPRPGGRQGAGPSDLQKRILTLLRERPLDKIEIAKELDLPVHQRTKLRDLLRAMEVEGLIARIRKDRYILPNQADLVSGEIQFHASGAAHILSEKRGEADVYIGAENTFTAMHGDRVVARLDAPRPGGAAPVKRQGRVIRILQRASDTIVGTLQKSKNFFYVVADDPRFVNNLYVAEPRPPLDAKIGDKVVARIDAWVSRHVNPEGHVVEVLGPATDPGVDMLSIIRKHRLPTTFPDDVVAEAKAVAPEVDARELRRREDLRHQLILTIDPDDAKDFDDAIHVERLADGWRVGIHIADVSHYVRPKSALDREAVGRGNSVYLVDRVIPMLPEELSNGICSLKPHVERLAFSVFAEISSAGKVRSSRFAKTVIRSAARLTYKQAFAILQKPPGTDPVAQRVHTAWELSSLLRRKRFEHGSLDLDFPEVKVWLDERGKPVRLEKIENDISHQLIEELMLLANELVARELKVRRQPTVYRIHEKPDPEKLVEYREFAMSTGLRCGDLTNRAELQKLLRASRGRPDEAAVKIGLLKSLKRARYAPDPAGHYGLAKPDYAHFTSPIRRYADLIVHRSLERLLGLTKHGPDAAALATLAEHISTTERVAADAEKESVKLKKLEFFQLQIADRSGAAFPAVISDVRNYGMFVDLPDMLLGGLVHVSSLDGDFFVFDPVRRRMVGRKSRKTYAAGDKVEVVVARVDTFKQQVDFKIV